MNTPIDSFDAKTEIEATLQEGDEFEVEME